MFKYVSTSLYIILFLFGSLAAIESGLRTRLILNHSFKSSITPNSAQKKILIVGDSVMGPLSISGTLSHGIKSSFRKYDQKMYSFIELTKGALSSGEAYSKIQSTIDKNKNIEVAIILLGNSDYTIPNQSDRTLTPQQSTLKFATDKIFYEKIVPLLNRFYIFRFFLNTKSARARLYGLSDDDKRFIDRIPEKFSKDFTQLDDQGESCHKLIPLFRYMRVLKESDKIKLINLSKNCLNKDLSHVVKSDLIVSLAQTVRDRQRKEEMLLSARKMDSSNIKVDLALAWHYVSASTDECAKAIPHFEAAFSKVTPRRRAAFYLHRCYINSGESERALSFYNSMIAKHKGMSDFFTYLHDSIALSKNNGHLDFEFQIKTRDDYIKALYSYKLKNMRKKANELFRIRNRFDDDIDSVIDIDSLWKLTQILRHNKTKVILLSYPNQSTDQLKEAIPLFDTAVTVIDTSSYIESKLDQVEILELFQDDFLHLTSFGAQVVGEGIADHVLSVIQQ
ncbi:MAG: hypothetical protein HUU57_00940 [Bdellovibrio sp.]|nr:hypothetical protein [Bdellovibrio sp.]